MIGRQFLNFADDVAGREAARFAADEWDHAVGTAEIAAILNFEDWASVVGFPAVDRSREEFGVGENIAGQDLGLIRRRIRIGHLAKIGQRILRPYKGMERGFERIVEERRSGNEIIRDAERVIG